MKTAIVITLGELEQLLQLYIAETKAKLDEQLILSKFLIWTSQYVKEQTNGQDPNYPTSSRFEASGSTK